jgi:tRNA(His) 5'-end guanylyltransferase
MMPETKLPPPCPPATTVPSCADVPHVRAVSCGAPDCPNERVRWFTHQTRREWLLHDAYLFHSADEAAARCRDRIQVMAILGGVDLSENQLERLCADLVDDHVTIKSGDAEKPSGTILPSEVIVNNAAIAAILAAQPCKVWVDGHGWQSEPARPVYVTQDGNGTLDPAKAERGPGGPVVAGHTITMRAPAPPSVPIPHRGYYLECQVCGADVDDGDPVCARCLRGAADPTDSLGARQKRYEAASKTVLTPRMPVIVRVDGKAFHTWTRGCKRPFDDDLIEAMNRVAIALCTEIQGAEIAYAQSDEVSVLVHCYKRFASTPWFDGEVQKIVSVTAAIAAAVMTDASASVHGRTRLAYFDSRVFAVPEQDVCNYFVWRQQDAERNSLQMAAHALYSQAVLHGKKSADLHELLHAKGVNWNDYPTHKKRGRCVVRAPSGAWVVDAAPPIFMQDRDYIERHLATEEK